MVGVYVTLNAEVGIVLRIGAKIAVDSHIGIDSTFDSALDVFANGIRQRAVVENRDFFADVFYESFVGNTVGLVNHSTTWKESVIVGGGGCHEVVSEIITGFALENTSCNDAFGMLGFGVCVINKAVVVAIYIVKFGGEDCAVLNPCEAALNGRLGGSACYIPKKRHTGLSFGGDIIDNQNTIEPKCLSLKKVDSKTMSYLCIKTAQKNDKSIMIQ